MKNIKIKIKNNGKYIIESDTEFKHIRIVKKHFSNELDTANASLIMHTDIGKGRLLIPIEERRIINISKKFDILNHIKIFKELNRPYFKFEVCLMTNFSNEESFVEFQIEYEQEYQFEKFRLCLN